MSSRELTMRDASLGTDGERVCKASILSVMY